MKNPTVVLQIDGSFITRSVSGEIVEAVDVFPDGTPNWSTAGICDPRGGAGLEGYCDLHVALNAAENNAKLNGIEIERVL